MNILVAIDFSDVTPCMLEALARLPAAKDAHVYLVHAAEPDPEFVGWDAGPDTVRDQVAAMFHREHRELEGHAETLRGGKAGECLQHAGSDVREVDRDEDVHGAISGRMVPRACISRLRIATRFVVNSSVSLARRCDHSGIS